MRPICIAECMVRGVHTVSSRQFFRGIIGTTYYRVNWIVQTKEKRAWSKVIKPTPSLICIYPSSVHPEDHAVKPSIGPKIATVVNIAISSSITRMDSTVLIRNPTGID